MAGDFLDILVAIVCLVCILRAHHVIRHILDLLIPGGPGPGGLGHGLMEGMGMALGAKFVQGGLKAGKFAAGMGVSAGLGGLAEVAKNKASQKALPKLSSMAAGAMGNSSRTAAGTSTQSLYPGGIDSGSNASGFLGNGEAQSSTGTGFGEGFMFRDPESEFSSSSSENADSSTGSTIGSAGRPTTPGSGHTKPSNTFDPSSRKGGAFTRVNPSMQSRLSKELGGTPKTHSQAFMDGAKNRLKDDLEHKFVRGNRGYCTGKSLLGVAHKDIDSARNVNKDASSTGQFISNALVPSQQILSDYSNGDPIAAESLMGIGSEQMAMQEGYGWIDRADQMESQVAPALEETEREYNAAEADYRQQSNIVLEMKTRGMTNTPEYQAAIARQHSLGARLEGSRETYNARSEQMSNIQDLRSRGNSRVVQARERIYSINDGYKPANNRQRDIETAMRSAGRRSFSDLY